MSSETLDIKTFPLGPWMTNCYVLSVGQACWIIDCGLHPSEMFQYIEDQALEPEAALLTHAHFDHIAGLQDLRTRWPELPIYVHTAESHFLTRPVHNLSAALGEGIVAPEATHTIPSTGTFSLRDVEFRIHHTPGHSPGSVIFHQPDHRTVIAGDTLFLNSIGRTDFPHSNPALLIESIERHLLSLPDETTVHPGHGPSTTIGREKASNPFLNAAAR